MWGACGVACYISRDDGLGKSPFSELAKFPSVKCLIPSDGVENHAKMPDSNACLGISH